jgi:Transposase domain (DUF772)
LVLLKLYIYGYLNRVQSSRRLEREAGRNVEVMWLLGRLAPDHKTIADFRKDNGPALRKVCARFVELCRELGLLATASVAIDGSKFKAVNNRNKNFTRAKVERRRAQLEEIVAQLVQTIRSFGETEGRADGLVDFLRGPAADVSAAMQQNLEEPNDSSVVDFDAGIADRTDGDRQRNPLQKLEVDVNVGLELALDAGSVGTPFAVNRPGHDDPGVRLEIGRHPDPIGHFPIPT